jgi:hypothetical protein
MNILQTNFISVDREVELAQANTPNTSCWSYDGDGN